MTDDARATLIVETALSILHGVSWGCGCKNCAQQYKSFDIYIAAALTEAKEQGRLEEREACAQIAKLFVEEFTDRRDDQLRDVHATAALMHARQAQTASDIETAIRSRSKANTEVGNG